MKTYAAKIRLSAAGVSPKRANEIKICANPWKERPEKTKNCCKNVNICFRKRAYRLS